DKNKNDKEFIAKLGEQHSEEISSLQLSKSPSSSPISQDSKETKDGPNNRMINGNKVIIDKSKDNWSGWLDEAIQKEHINFYEYSSSHDMTNMKEIANELKLLRKVNHHQNIIHLYGNGKYLLVLEYADSGTLRSYLQEKCESISWDLKLKFAYEIASAHSNNILVHQKTIKLADFGLSRKILESTTTSTFKLAGVLPYIDPQCFKHSNKQVYKPNKKSDVYSVGVLLWELTSNKPPFSNLDPHYQQFTLMLDISQGVREEPIPNTLNEYINLYKACWQDDPKSRPDIQYVETMLNGMISGSNIVDKIDNEENDEQPKNENNDFFSHSSDVLQEDFDNKVKELSEL
ncbi:11882_t:CDS:2, partial [Entrophospora sp. SA101]